MALFSQWIKRYHLSPQWGKVGVLDYVDFVRYVAQRFTGDRCTAVAASLSFTSMLSAVPVITIAFALFAAFPVFENVRGQIETTVFQNFLPHTGAAVRDQLAQFTQNAERLTAVGIGALAVTALMTLVTIEKAFNIIWRSEQARPAFQRLVLYWSFMTLGPLFLGMSISVSSYIFTLQNFVLDEDTAEASFGFLATMLPFLLATTGFFFGYKVVPSRPVAVRHALIGAIVASVLFETLKNGFGYYVQNFPTYQAIYGAMSVLPLFLIWMYLVWNAVLVGAEVAASLPEWHSIRKRGASQVLPPAQRLVLALRLLKGLLLSAKKGQSISEEILLDQAGDLSSGLQSVLNDLRRSGYIMGDQDGGFRLCRDLAEVPVYVLFSDLGYGWPRAAEVNIHDMTTPHQNSSDTFGAAVGLEHILEAVDVHIQEEASLSVKDLLLAAPKAAHASVQDMWALS